MILHTAKGEEFRVDAEDAEKVIGIRWCINSNGYVVTTVNKRTAALFDKPVGASVRLHRWIMDAPDGMQVDHINHDKSDNRKQNLRLCTAEENQCNRRSGVGLSQYKGVSFRPDSPNKPWRATIWANYRKHSLGSFRTEEEAALAYNEAAKELHGDYAMLKDVSGALAPDD